MKKQDVETIVADYLKPVFGFALKRCKNRQDAEDLSQEIMVRVFGSLLKREDIDDPGRYIWTVAHHALSNYYRDGNKRSFGLSPEEITEGVTDGPDISSGMILREETERLQHEIAYLSSLQRRIVVAYYYEKKKQAQIAAELNLPLGTVKWHLFEAKKNLKRGMETMRLSSELKFRPIRFSLCGTNGSVGTKGGNSNFFRTALPQNIEYAVWREPKTVNEIADSLGVSPVYVEDEAAYLEEYGFLKKKDSRYLCNILLEEPSSAYNRLESEIYEKAAKIFANECFDALMSSEFWEMPGITFGGADSTVSPETKNFGLWSLIPYLAAQSGEAMIDQSVSFDEAATVRPDGGQNICYAPVWNPGIEPPKYFDSILQWFGPCWNGTENLILWQIDSEWSGRRIGDGYLSELNRLLPLLNRWINGGELSKEETADLISRGLLSRSEQNGELKTALGCIFIDGAAAKQALLSVGEKIREKHRAEFDSLRKTLSEAALKEIPEHLHTMKKFGLQFLFYCDGWFCLHCLKELVNSGRLKIPSEEEKRAMTMILIRN